jgi:rSAM/selenodomain-associated transferase 1
MTFAANDQVLGLFAKLPVAGEVKSRLGRETSPVWAAQVADAFLRDSLDRLARIAAQRFLVYSPAGSERFFEELGGDRFQLLAQGDGDLGQRLERFLRGQVAAGAKRIVVVGSDSPTLPVEYIEQAFAELRKADVVLGPASDGGYYLVGCGRRVPPIFEAIDWGSDRVLDQTLARLREASWQPALLPTWYDVDTLADWRKLQGEVAALRRAGVDPGIPHTERLLC